MKNAFELIEYNGIPYPEGYISRIKEVAGHLDKEEIEQEDCYSLHTEYSYGKRKLDTEILNKYKALREAHKGGVPQLWKSEKWAKEFAAFICELTADKNAPSIIEIHPPFNDYADIEHFVKCYRVFEKEIKQSYPNTNIFIENRSGAVYRGGRFVVGKADEIVSLCEAIEKYNLDLGTVLDFPQLLTAERLDTLKFDEDKYIAAIEKIHPYQYLIKGIHIWEKRKIPKVVGLLTAELLIHILAGTKKVKQSFLTGLRESAMMEKQDF